MSKTDVLISQEILRPSELRKFGKRVTVFTSEKVDDEYHWGQYNGEINIVSIPALPDEKWHDHIVRIQHKVQELLEGYPCEFYTGLHKESDWSKTFYWDKGWHIVNRTGDYAVITDKVYPAKE